METIFPRFNGAKLSANRKHRYYLYRIWDRSKPSICFIGLNPSTANEDKNDPTIRKLIKWTYSNGYGGFYMFNLFTIVSPDPSVLSEPGEDFVNNLETLNEFSFDKIVFCWGAFDTYGRDKEMIHKFPEAYCFKKNKDGSPAHPLYLPKDIKLIKFKDQ